MSDDAARETATPPRPPTVDDFPDSGPNALATFAQRAWGRALDTVIVFGVLIIIIQSTVDPADPEASYASLARAVPFAWFVLALTYEVVMVALLGMTVGKLAFGTRIARFTDGRRPTWGQAFLRALLPLGAAALVLLLTGFDVIGAAVVYFTAMANPLLRGFHDQAGGTVVIRTR